LFITSIIGRVDVDALDLPGVVGQEGFEGQQVIALDEQVAAAGLADGNGRVLRSRWKGTALWCSTTADLPIQVRVGMFPLQASILLAGKKGSIWSR